MFFIVMRSSIEFALIVLLLYGFWNEKKVIEFEQLLKRAIVIRYRLYKKNKRLAEMRKNREFKVVSGKRTASKAQKSSLYVA